MRRPVHMIRPVRAAAAFTLTELLIAVGVLVVVITAAAKIFSAASKVSAVAEANADLIQTANAIESQIRNDFASIPRNGFMVLQQVEVVAPNPATGTQEIRADQIAFFSRASRTTSQYIGSQEGIGGGANGDILQTWGAESAVARVYYGHGVIAPALPISTGPYSYENSNATLVPWKSGAVELERWPDGAAIGTGNLPTVQPANWPLVRLATLLASDGLPTTVNGGSATTTTFARFASSSVNASVSLFTNRVIRVGPLATAYPNTYAPLWLSGRVDVVKWQPDDLYSQMAYQPSTNQQVQGLSFVAPNFSNPWTQSSSRLRMIQTLANWAAPTTSGSGGNGATQLYLAYPRVEKVPPSASRSDVMLTAPVLAANCSSFKIEWTWKDGVGRSFSGSQPGTSPNGNEPVGMVVLPGKMQPWFGLNYAAAGQVGNSSVRPVSSGPNFLANGVFGDWGTVGLPLVVASQGNMICSVEGPLNPAADNMPIWACSNEQGGKRVYQAVFGFNQSDTSAIDPRTTERGPYTPLPSALRVTLRLHDTLGRIEGGREFQFIIDIPAR